MVKARCLLDFTDQQRFSRQEEDGNLFYTNSLFDVDGQYYSNSYWTSFLAGVGQTCLKYSHWAK